MPSKKRKKKKKQQNETQDNLLDFDLYFDDLTILQTDGSYDRVCEIMEAPSPIVVIKDGRPLRLDSPIISGKPAYSIQDNTIGKDWCIKSNLTIFSSFGQGQITLDFFNDGRVFIIGFMSSNMSQSQNMDVRCLSSWCQSNGWQVPQVSPDLARENLKFWKHWWESLIIDSDYFDERFGKRRALDMRNAVIDDDEEDDEVIEEPQTDA